MYLVLKAQQVTTAALLQSKASIKPHADYLPQWRKAMAKGTLNGRAYSNRTIDDYCHYTDLFFGKHQRLSVEALRKELMLIPARNFAKREHYYKALLCLGRYLVGQGTLTERFLDDLKPIYPKRHLPPKRFTVDEQGLKSLMAACTLQQDRVILALLSNTGLRATEACSLRWGDLDLEAGCLLVRVGKGGKQRRIGLPQGLTDILKGWQAVNPTAMAKDPLLLNRLGRPMDASGLYQRLARVGKLAGVQVSPHALRRAFVTINAGRGRPMIHLQRACGHSSIRTTETYCLTAEQEVIEAMKGWE